MIGVVVGAVAITVLTLVTVVVWTLVRPMLLPEPTDEVEPQSEEPGS